jgi:hypothetical protein
MDALNNSSGSSGSSESGGSRSSSGKGAPVLSTSSRDGELSLTSSALADVDEDERFLIDLEFVQNLCNIEYLHYLAQNKYFEDAAFLNYLKYLRYWKKPSYMTFLLFPQCLDFLDILISSPRFRKELNVPQFVAYCHEQQGLQWMYDVATDSR